LKFISQSIPDVILIEPDIISDNRGYFIETYKQNILNKFLGYKTEFIQDNESKSFNGVLRGLHYQLYPFTQAKLVRVVQGKVLVVAVDLRKKSKTFSKYVSQEICSVKKKQLFIPRGFAHGFVVLSEVAIFNYKVDNYYSPKFERGIAFNDKDLSIDWKIPQKSLIISDKDKKNPLLSKTKYLLE
jgi:dTDP-4-dehydrorhamnose 3,5-epimerase